MLLLAQFPYILILSIVLLLLVYYYNDGSQAYQRARKT